MSQDFPRTEATNKLLTAIQGYMAFAKDSIPEVPTIDNSNYGAALKSIFNMKVAIEKSCSYDLSTSENAIVAERENEENLSTNNLLPQLVRALKKALEDPILDQEHIRIIPFNEAVSKPDESLTQSLKTLRKTVDEYLGPIPPAAQRLA